MEGTYPIVINGELAGKLSVSVRGAKTVFDAECKKLPGIVRLSVYGGGREGCLGVLCPEGEKMSLHKAFSRSELRDFPEVIDSVEPAGLHRAPEPEPLSAPEPVSEEAPEPTPEAGRRWFSSPDGVLVCFDGEKNLAAFPAGDERIPAEAAGEDCTVEGRAYRVFPTENGRVVWH